MKRRACGEVEYRSVCREALPWLVVLLACFSLGWPDAAAARTAATLTVCQTGAIYKTIQSAVTAAVAGDRIEVCAGDFTEQVEVTKSLTIVGAGPQQTRIVLPAMADRGPGRRHDQGQRCRR